MKPVGFLVVLDKYDKFKAPFHNPCTCSKFCGTSENRQTVLRVGDVSLVYIVEVYLSYTPSRGST